MVELRSVNVHYGLLHALSDVDLRVEAGEIVGLLGDTGAGKSTLLKVIAGALDVTTGDVGVAAGVQMLYQDLALIEGHDIATNLTLGREPLLRGAFGRLGFLDKRAMREQARRELSALGVTLEPVTRAVETLSGGQRQVVALARAAWRVGDGGVLLLDEPTAALGYDQTRRVEALARQLAGRGVAVIVATHNLPLCFEIADRVVVLNRGRKVADVPAAETNQDETVGWITGARDGGPA
jgi:simple sugar transport system ATP-binding protein